MNLRQLRAIYNSVVRVILLVVTIVITEIAGLYYYLRSQHPDRLDSVLSGDQTEMVALLTSIDVVLVALGLAVLAILADYIARRTVNHRGAGS